MTDVKLKEPTAMQTHTFTLIVEGPDLQTEAMIDALFEAGCDDSLVGSVDGVQYVEFDREAESLEQAVLSAVDDLESVDGVMVVRLADAGLISMADIAARTGRTREGVRLLISGERGPGGSHLLLLIPAAGTGSGGWSRSSNGLKPTSQAN